jgi:hypothetical protein
MRALIPVLMIATMVAGSAYGQPSGATSGGSTPTTTALSPNNCGTPDEPKPCPGAKGMSYHHTMTHKAAAHPAATAHPATQKSQ